MWFYRTLSHYTLRISRQILEDSKDLKNMTQNCGCLVPGLKFRPFSAHSQVFLEKVCITAFLELVLPVYNRGV